jgi:hypothetical protein
MFRYTARPEIFEIIKRQDLMTRLIRTLYIAAIFCSPWAQNLAAQAPPTDPVSFNFDGGLALQSSTDFSDIEGSFSVNRWFVGLGVNYAWNRRNALGLYVGGGNSKYDFDDRTTIGGGAPWEEIEDTRISLIGRFGFGEKGSFIIIPTARYNGEKDADTSEGRTWGLFAAAAWRLNENLTIGPGIGVFQRLEDGTRIFPVLAIDWNISERWNLSTGGGLASSQGPGLTLSYKLSKVWSFGLTSRYEKVEFRLDEDGTTPNGIGRDQSIPLVLSAVWEPNKNVKLAAFAGMEFAGKLKLKDAYGDLISESDYDTAPIYGGSFELRF